MRKLFSILLALAMAIGLLGGCANNTTPGTTGTTGQTTTTTGETITLTAGTEATEGNLYYESLNYLKEVLEKNSNGRIQVKIYPNSELGDELSMMEQVRSGNLDISIIGGANLASLVPELQILSVPYMFKDYDTFVKGMSSDSDLWKLLVDTVASKNAGVQLAAPTTIGSRWVVNTKGEVKTPADMKTLNLKMRVQSNPVEAQVWSTFGATPTNMPMTDVFTAMQQGVVDAVENAPDILYNYKIQEVAKYFSATDHNWYFAAVLAGDKMWEKIPDDLKDVVTDAFNECGKHTLEVTPEFQDKAISALRDSGVTITEDVDKDAFRNMILGLYDQVAKSCGGEQILAAVNAL